MTTVLLQSLKVTYCSSDARYLLWTAAGSERTELIDLIIHHDDPEPLIAINNVDSILNTLIVSMKRGAWHCAKQLINLYKERRPEELVGIRSHNDKTTGSDERALRSVLHLPDSHREALLGLFARSLLDKQFQLYVLIMASFQLDRYILGVDMLPYCIKNGKEWLQLYLDARLDIADPIQYSLNPKLTISPLLYAAPYKESFELLLPLYQVEPVLLSVLVSGMGAKQSIGDLMLEYHGMNTLSGLLYCICSAIAFVPYYTIIGPPSLVFPLANT